MINKKIMLVLAAAATAVMLLAGCLNPFEPQLDRGKKAAAGNGYVTISINKADGRTILPENTQESFTQYKLEFFLAGQTQKAVKIEFLEPGDISDEIEIPVGTYDLYVTAYTDFKGKEDDSQNTAVAKGSLLNLKVENDKPSGANVKLFAIEDGSGTFRWSITYPAGASATITIDPLDDGLGGQKIWTIADTPSADNEKGKADSVELRSGTYRVTFDLLDNEGRSLKRSDILHVYMNMESFFGKNGEGDFKEDYFIIKRVNSIALAVATIPTNTPLTLEGVVSPSTATFKDIEWEIIGDPDNTGATITDGVFFAKLAKKTGVTKVTLKATIEHGAGYLTDYVQEDNLEVTVTYVEVDGVEVDPEEIEMEDGETVTITARVTPLTATNKELKWSIADPTLFQIIYEGYEEGTVGIKALKFGNSNVTVKAADNDRFEVDCVVKVKEVPLTGITLSAEYVMLPVGASTNLIAIFAPANASHKELIWTSDVTSIKVKGGENPGEGLVTVNNADQSRAVISVTNSEGKMTATCIIIVDTELNAGYLGDVKLHTTSMKLQVGRSTQLFHTITPEDAEPYRVYWTSGDFNVVSVVDDGKIRIGHGNPEPDDPDYDEVFKDRENEDDEDGWITALKPGIVDIVVTTMKGGKTAVCRVEAYAADPAKPPVTDIALPQGLHFKRGFPDYIEPIFTPENAGNKNLLWYSSDTSIADVGLTTGLVTAKIPGFTTISVITEDSGLTAECEIEVDFVAVTGVRIITGTLRMGLNQKLTLRYTVEPDNATYKNVEWSIRSGDEAVVDVNATTGEVTYKGGGTGSAEVYVKTIANAQQPEVKTATCRITGRNNTPLVTDVRLNLHKLRAATDPSTPPMPLVATITPENAYYNTKDDLSWYSTDISVATVDQNGQVTGKKAGQVQIIVMTHDGGITDMCEVEIYEGKMAVTDITISADKLNIVKSSSTSSSSRGGLQLFANIQPFGTTGEIIWEVEPMRGSGIFSSGYSIDQTGLVQFYFDHNNYFTIGTVTAISVEGGFTKTCTIEPIEYSAIPYYSSNTKYYQSTYSLDLEVEKEATFTVYIIPDPSRSAVVSEVVWYSTNPAVAEVDYETGVITGKTPGETTIIATFVVQRELYYNANNYTRKVAVTVRDKGDGGPAVDGVRLNTNAMTLFRGQSSGAPLQAFIGPFVSTQSETTAAKTGVYWSSSNMYYATVDQNGVVTAHATLDGTATITATTIDGGYTDTCTVTVRAASGTIVGGLDPIVWKYLTLNLSSNLIVGEYNYGAFKPVLLPRDGVTAAYQPLTYRFSNPAIATVDESNGRITAAAVGKTLVTATTVNGYRQSIEVIVVPAGPGGTRNAAVQSVSKITMPATLTVKDGAKIPVTVEPVNASKELVWTSSDPNVATVDQTGTITITRGKYSDTTLFTATTVDGGKSGSCTVTIGVISPEVLISGHTDGNFYMGKYQITQAEYQAVMGVNPSYFRGSDRLPDSGEVQKNRPVEQVGYYWMLIFCNRLSVREGLTPAYEIIPSIGGTTKTTDTAQWGSLPPAWNDYERWMDATVVAGSTGYRSPTVAQWQYAYRAGSTTTYYWGNTWNNSYGWIYDNSNSRTHEVGKKLPNAWGLYDMSGNVNEFCLEKYDVSNRMVRGGSYNSSSSNATPSFNSFAGMNDSGYSSVGLRLVRPAP